VPATPTQKLPRATSLQDANEWDLKKAAGPDRLRRLYRAAIFCMLAALPLRVFDSRGITNMENKIGISG
jgi:hypothetical protein